MTISVGVNCRAKRALIGVAVIVGLLLLDGQLGPFTFRFRRVSASALLAIVLLGIVRPKGRWASFFASWAAVVLTAVMPTVPLSLLAYVFVVAMAGVNTTSATSPLAPGLPQSCLTYVGLVGFLPNLFPQTRVLSEALSASAHGYLRIATGTDHYLSPTALCGPALFALMVYLLWRWRLSGAWVRLLAVAAAPVAWFLLFPLVHYLSPTALGGPALFALMVYLLTVA